MDLEHPRFETVIHVAFHHAVLWPTEVWWLFDSRLSTPVRHYSERHSARCEIVSEMLRANLDHRWRARSVALQASHFDITFVRARPSIAFSEQSQCNDEVLIQVPNVRLGPVEILVQHQFDAQVQ